MNWEQIATALNLIEHEIQNKPSPEDLEQLRKILLFKAFSIEQKQTLRVA